MVRSKFPGKPTKHSSRTRVHVLSGPLNNNAIIGQLDNSNINNAGDVATNQDVACSENTVEISTAHLLPCGAESDLMRVRLTRTSFLNDQILAANVQCSDQIKRDTDRIFENTRRIRVSGSANVDIKTAGKFVLPSRSVHSSRVIKPNKRFITVDTTDMLSYKTRVIKKRQCILQCGRKKRSLSIPVNNDMIMDPPQSLNEAIVGTRIGKKRRNNKRDDGHARSGGMATRNRVVLRQARLKIQASASTSKVGPFSSGNKPGTITCGVCLIPRFFNKRTFLQTDKFNIYSCDACSAFIVSVAEQVSAAAVVCRRGDGKCYDIKPDFSTENRSRSMRSKSGIPNPLKRLHRSSVARRCRACWLKICLHAFQMPVALRATLTKRLPADMQEHNLFGGTVSLPAKFLNAWYAEARHSVSSSSPASTDKSSTSTSTISNQTQSSLSDYSTWVDLPSSTRLDRPILTQVDVPTSTPKPPRKRQAKSQPQPQRQRYYRVARDKGPSKGTVPALAVAAVALEVVQAAPPVPPLIPLMDAAVKRQKINLRGPRVKHVCRSASIALGHAIATFPALLPIVAPPVAIPGGPKTADIALDPTEEDSSTDSSSDGAPAHVGTLPIPIMAATTDIPSVWIIADVINLPSVTSPRTILELDSPIHQQTDHPIDSVSIKCDQTETVPAVALITKKEKKAHLTSQLDVQYFAPTRKLNTNLSRKPKNVLSIDFWESYDFEEVCRNGFSLTGTAPFPMQAICFLCGSAGAETLLHCCLCCEPYHPYCLEQTPPLFRQPADRFSWLCPRCTTCTACGHADRQKINCQKCHNTYHPQCFNTKWRTDDRPTVCSNCLRCKSCGTDNITKFVGNLALCLLCFKLRNKGNFCPLCQRCYDDNDFDTKMMECGRCNKWVHSKCEGLSDEQYQILSILPESVEYLCCLCSTEATPYWRKAIQAELKNSFNAILCMLNKNQIARPLLKLTPVKTICSTISTPKLSHECCNIAKRILFTDEIMCDPTIDEDLFDAAKIESKRNSSSSDTSTPAFDIPLTPNIADIKRKINCNEYFSLWDFNNGMETALRANGSQSKQLLEIYHSVLKKVFPWFDPTTEESSIIDVSFADASKLDINLIEPDKKVDYKSYAVLIELEKPVIETRLCSLCKGLGDGSPQEEARLLYCGHNEWIHGNCALWSSEVYEEIDGSLQNVHGAINRGKSIKCTLCKLRGASIGCCQKGCFESYHFICAKKSDCQFMADKSIYCMHHDTTDLNSSVTIDFDIRRSIYVELDSRKKKYIESYKVNYIVGSLSVLNLGLVSASVSDTVDAIIPTSFVCSRLFWSTKSPWQLVPYVIKTSILKSASKMLPIDKNFTVDHSQPKHTVDRKLKELSTWLKDDKDVLTLAEFDDEEEPQNTADILSPELTDAILQELPHGLLDGLMNMDFKNSEININELNGKSVPTDLLDMDVRRPATTNNSSQQPIQQQRSCSLRLSCKVNSPAMKKRKTQPAPPRENVYLHLLVDGPCDSSSGSECDSPEPATYFDDDEEEEDYERDLSGAAGEQPVTCLKCHCTYRTHASYARHLDTCTDPIFTSESDSEEQNQHVIVCPTPTVIADADVAAVVLNVNKKQPAVMPTILRPTYETYSLSRHGDTTTSMTEYLNQQLGASIQQQLAVTTSDSCLPQVRPQELSFSHQPTTTFVVSNNADESQFALPINTFNIALNQLPLTLQSVPSVYSNVNQITIEPANMNQLTIDAKLMQGHQGTTWGMKSVKSPRTAQYIATRKAQTTPQTQTLLVQQQPNAQVYIQSLPSNGQLVTTVPTFMDSNGSFVSTGSNQVQYVTANAAPQTAPTTTVLQLHQATADGSFINLVPSIQMQPQSTPLYSIQPSTARLEGGQIVVDNSGSMLWSSAPAATAPVAPAAAQAQSAQQSTQPLFYGFETIVQNTVMQSQQFLPTTMSGMLSSNSSYSTTTQNSFQVFQTSKLEPVLDMSRGGFVLTPSQPTILNATAATYSPQDALSQLSFITPQTQQTSFTDQPIIQQPTAAILRTIKAEPFESYEPLEPQQRPVPPQQLLLAKMSRQQALQLQQPPQKAIVELTVQTSQVQQQHSDTKPIVARTTAIPITYSPKSAIKHRPISRVLPMPTNPVKKLDLGPQQYRSKTAKKSTAATNTMALQIMKQNTVQAEQKVHDNVLEVIKQNEEIARVKQEIIRAKEEIIKAKQEIVKTKEIIIPMNVSPNLLGPSITKVDQDDMVIGSLAMPSASSPQLIEAPILPPLEVTKMGLGSPKLHEFLIDDVRKAAQNTFPPVKSAVKEPERPPIMEHIPVLDDDMHGTISIEQTNPLNELVNTDQISATNQVIQAELVLPHINMLALSSSVSLSMVEEAAVDVTKGPAQASSAPSMQPMPITKHQLPAQPLILNGLSLGEAQKVIENSEPSILYTIETHDGFKHSSTSIYELWSKVFDAVQLARQAHNMPPLPMSSLDMISNIQLLGLKTNGLRYLVEQMPGAVKCTKYKPIFNVQLINKDEKSLVGSPVHKRGAVRMVPYHGERKPYDMFGWLTSKHRRPDFVEETPSRRIFSTSSSVSARYRLLKETCKLAVGVYPSDIHGRGLFAKTVIESGDMVIEYAGEVIRSVLTDKREKYYNSKGIGCYMFRIDEDLVVDSTMKGNSARFINHSCDPNCYSKVVEIQGHKHIIIFALRRILCGEELTYDYKFPIEDDKIPCTCSTKRCRKFLN